MILSVIDENIVLLKSSTGVGCKTYESRYIIVNSILEIIEFLTAEIFKLKEIQNKPL